MTTTRRDFLRTSIAAGGAVALTSAAGAAAMLHQRREKKTLLVLGGTGFIGPHIIDAAKAAGYEVTTFNRGRTEVLQQRPIDGVEKIFGDRDPNVGDGLSNLEARIKEKGGWDAVIDNSGYVPRITRASAELLAPVVKQYVFVSTLSVYADNSQAGNDESAALATMEDPTNEEVRAHYGALKALCEKSVEEALPGRACNVRPGFIVGPGDPTDRFTYWPVRFSKGGDVLIPGTAEDPVQFIDVRDLAAWMIHLVGIRATGAFNATGPIGGCTFGGLAEACQRAAGVESKPVFIPADFLTSQGVGAGAVTILIPKSNDDYAGFHQRSIEKATRTGLKTRPVIETVRDTLAWWPAEVERRARVTRERTEEAKAKGEEPPKFPDPLVIRAGLPPEREAAILSAWREHLDKK